MAEIVILGSGSGFATRDRFCTSIALLVEPNLYLFDCGEPCSALLFRNGIDLLALKTLFISHMHPDHVGGLPGLLSTIGLASRTGRNKVKPWSVHRNDPWYRAALSFPKSTAGGESVTETRPHINVVVPSEAIEPIQAFLPSVYIAPSKRAYDLEFLPVQEGVTFADEMIKVTAAPNTHLSAIAANALLKVEHPQLALLSYSYAVEVAGTKVVYSGDITALAELNSLLQGADVLLLESAHYDPHEIGPFVHNLPLRRIVLTHIHPGLEERLPDLIKSWGDPRIEMARDGMRVPLDPGGAE